MQALIEASTGYKLIIGGTSAFDSKMDADEMMPAGLGQDIWQASLLGRMSAVVGSDHANWSCAGPAIP
jgi:hypothetical protein